MKITNGKFFTILSLLALSVVLFATQCQHDVSETSVAERAVYGEAALGETALKNGFSPERVMIVLDGETSLNFRAYTPKDFPEIACAGVRIW